MKKAAIFIVMVCYLAVSTGVIVNSHYCMNKLASTQLFSTGNKKCGKCGMHMDDAHGCCRDEVSIVKMDDDQKLAAVADLSIPPLALEAQDIPAFAAAQTPAVQLNTDRLLVGSPPLLQDQDTYLENCVFRI